MLFHIVRLLSKNNTFLRIELSISFGYYYEVLRKGYFTDNVLKFVALDIVSYLPSRVFKIQVVAVGSNSGCSGS